MNYSSEILTAFQQNTYQANTIPHDNEEYKISVGKAGNLANGTVVEIYVLWPKENISLQEQYKENSNDLEEKNLTQSSTESKIINPSKAVYRAYGCPVTIAVCHYVCNLISNNILNKIYLDPETIKEELKISTLKQHCIYMVLKAANNALSQV